MIIVLSAGDGDGDGDDHDESDPPSLLPSPPACGYCDWALGYGGSGFVWSLSANK